MLQRHLKNTTDVPYDPVYGSRPRATCKSISQTTTVQSIACRQSFMHSSTSMHSMLCYRRWKCIRRSSQSRKAPSRVLAVEAMLACCSRTTQDCTGCIHSMHCIPVSKPIHPAAGARHITRYHCHDRVFLFLSQTAKDIPSVVNER